ncbi:ABC transporter permease [Microbacterium sp. SZ1]|uniref:carbohydrate ABC transporter permease n=1 Tax=Microbacterium sp. SZ1 TaxID=1849736 RepID=UPI000BCCC2C4|nr:carbohydrate ABC transporter permease [Microbacterium sp. SZ1]PCE14372.1 ABC transporter permease [Microbacterium sp. SZ1]
MALPLARTSPERHDPLNPRRSKILLIVMIGYALYTVIPLVWLLFSATKTQSGLFSSFGLWFADDFAFVDNLVATLTYRDGIFLRWLGNTLLYVVVGAGGATLLATMAGYGLAKFRFPGRRAVFAIVLGAVAVPGTALAVPTFLLFSELGLTNTPWAVIIPSLISPFGLYLIWVFASESVPTELLEAARIDGAGEFRTFFTISMRLLAPGIVTVALFTVVATWNNYFLPLIMLSDPDWYPLTVGLNQWSAQAIGAGSQPIYNLVIMGSLLTIIPIVIAFLLLQRFWQSGLTAGSVKQ